MKIKPKWVKTDTNEWALESGSETLVEISREKPSRWHANGVGGLVTDRSAKWQWDATLWLGDAQYQNIALDDGLTVRQAKRKAERLLAASVNPSDGGASD